AIYGTGYAGGEVVNIAFGTNAAIQTAQASTYGSLTAAFTIDTQAYGSTMITASGTLSAAATNSLFIIPDVCSVSPSKGIVGTLVTIKGTGYAAVDTVIIRFGTNENIQSDVSDDKGYFEAIFTVDTQTVGRTTIKAFSLMSATAENVFEIIGGAMISPTSGTIGVMVEVSGSGFGSMDLIAIHFGAIRSVAECLTDDRGVFATSFVVGAQPYGTTSVIAVDDSRAEAQFFVLPQVTSVLSTSGTVGTVVTVTGTGYAANDSITVAFGTNSNIKQIVAELYGSFITTFTVDTQSFGTTTITISGATAVASNVFVIQPQVTSVLPANGTVGTVVAIAGTGYAAGDNIAISLGTNTSIQQTIADNRGWFETVFTVDTQGYGETIVTASGAIAVATSTFFIYPQVTEVLPISGTVGMVVTVSGTGYESNDLVNIAFGTNNSIQHVFVSGYGSWTTTFTIDVQRYGTCTITASGAIAVAANTFFIQPQVTSVLPTSGTVGTVVTIAGTGYGANDSITVAFGTNSSIKQTAAGLYGSFTTTFTIDTQIVGTTTITASGATAVASNVFVIQPQVYSVLPTSGTVGTVVTIAGTGYGANDSITVAFGTNSSIKQATGGQYGSWTTTFTIDTQQYGTCTITASGATAVAANTFFIQPQVYNVLPTTGTVGTVVTIAGTGYGANDSITVAFGTNSSIRQTAAGLYGSFTTTFTVDTQVVGTCTITASGAFAVASNVFIIQPQVYSVLPTTGTVGTVVTIAGTGYGANDSITVAFGTNNSIKQTVASQYGSFSTTWTVDTQAVGTTTITVFGAFAVASNVFIIQPQVYSVLPTAGTVGTVVTIAGTGYAAGDSITIAFGTNSNIKQTTGGQYGSWTTTFTVDVQRCGTTTITASGAVAVASNVFVI
ncbi:MAG: hypothetical protein AAB296_00410, partial [Candidatus Desantisbacteria bacterium]